MLNSRFPFTRRSYNAVSVASDGMVYYVLSSHSLDVGAQMFAYNPASGAILHLGDITAAAGEAGIRAIPQGKSHVRFVESNGKLFFATHLSHYAIVDGREAIGAPPPGYGAYPGGHFLSYDLASGEFQDLGKVSGQGIITMAMDSGRGLVYGLTWPGGLFAACDLSAGNVQCIPVSGDGESGAGDSYRTICRALVVDPGDGSAYFTAPDGAILCYRPAMGAIEAATRGNLRKDYFGSYDTSSPFHMSYHWRQAVWHHEEQVVYGVHGTSGYLFRFDPATERVDLIERLTSAPSRRSGMYDMFSHGYLGFALAPDLHTLYYLTGGRLPEGKQTGRERVKLRVGLQGPENIHLVTYDISTCLYCDHGPVFLDAGRLPQYVQSLAIGTDGSVYSLCTVQEAAGERTDLMCISPAEQ